jgi:hypothetical protein
MKWYRRVVAKHNDSAHVPPFVINAVIDGERIVYVEHHRAPCITYAVPTLILIITIASTINVASLASAMGIAVYSVIGLIGALFGSLSLFFAGAKRTLVIDRHRATIEFRLFGRFVESVQAPYSAVTCMKQMCWVNTNRIQSVMVRVMVRVDSDFFCIAMHNDSDVISKHVMVLEQVSGLSVVSGPPAELLPDP